MVSWALEKLWHYLGLKAESRFIQVHLLALGHDLVQVAAVIASLGNGNVRQRAILQLS